LVTNQLTISLPRCSDRGDLRFRDWPEEEEEKEEEEEEKERRSARDGGYDDAMSRPLDVFSKHISLHPHHRAFFCFLSSPLQAPTIILHFFSHTVGSHLTDHSPGTVRCAHLSNPTLQGARLLYTSRADQCLVKMCSSARQWTFSGMNFRSRCLTRRPRGERKSPASLPRRREAGGSLMQEKSEVGFLEVGERRECGVSGFVWTAAASESERQERERGRQAGRQAGSTASGDFDFSVANFHARALVCTSTYKKSPKVSWSRIHWRKRGIHL